MTAPSSRQAPTTIGAFIAGEGNLPQSDAKAPRLACARASTTASAPYTLTKLLRAGCYRARVRVVTDQVLASLMVPTAEVLAGHWWTMTEVHRTGAAVTRRPILGERGMGYGVSGKIASVAETQPLAGEGVWRVILAGESIGRLVRRDDQEHEAGAAGWRLLQLDDLTETQLDAYEAAMSGATAVPR